jgi:sugar transferase (PEP-CTERM/EpsH1 system associated)
MNGKPLIAHVLYRLDPGGMERVMVSLIKATGDRYRHAVIVLAGFGRLRLEVEGSVVACLSLDKKPGKDWPCYFRFWRMLRKLKPDLVQTYNIGTLDLAPVVRMAGIRRLVHAEHGRDASDPNGDVRKHHRMRRWMTPFITRYVAVSADLEKWLTDRVGVPATKVTHIANGIDTGRFATVRDPSRPRRLLGDLAPAGTVLIGNIARLDKVKDHAGLLAAFKLLREQSRTSGADCRLFIAGDGPQRAVLEQQVLEAGLAQTVRMLGHRDDVAELLAECDIFALSSVAEGMPLTLLEAMSAGLPVVATAVGDVAMVVEDGVTGTLVPVANPVALASAVAAYAADERLRRLHGEAGRARAEAHFSLRAMTSAYESLYDEVLQPRMRVGPSSMASRLTERKEH